ncbi:HAD-superfamily subfamily IB hydrolase, TIGR01490 [Pasteurella testudinis DSM 23072]|uniref:HAD-superfamily subfamily IB hydrolase, TIGR01490 n=1 Tax=Pasteurella testudinis DSM 23072 TaxID=1122938 RepID=A0A1W1UE65_9PAST|nr:HAD family hydrolase [Pasteurella testudinis]SMB79339.1 HAD-superfamily subfamily IB hydrolase, TIGR01490 [Pasteurella testudinis DSM 23072]SUB50794.1 Phosphoserine phosphatase [Pasteurella testudinis]
MSLVLFDLDDTLIDGDSASLWSEFMLHRGLADQDFVEQEQAMMQKYAAGEMSMDDYMAFTLAPLRGMSQTEIAKQTALFALNEIEPRVYPAAKETVKQAQLAGQRLIVISATADFVVQAAAKRLGIREVIAIQTELVDGHYTGNTVGVLSYQQGKVTRLQDYLGEDYPDLMRTATFYSDSRNDLPLLNEVGCPKVVNPDRTLRQYAEKCGWPILRWQRENG